MNPDAILKDFHAIDVERRAAITEAETLKAQRNKTTEEIAQLKKNKQDASALIEATKDMREKIAAAEKRAEESDARLRNILTGFPIFLTIACPSAKARPTTSKCAVGARRRNSTSLPSPIGNWEKNWACSIWSARPS